VAARRDAWERVLLVDDDPDVQDLVSMALGQHNGFTVQVCGSPSKALKTARSFRPDLILLDVMMPGRDGREILKLLRADDATAEIPVVFMSAAIDRNDVQHYEHLGALGVIPKPFDAAGLPATLKRIRGGRPVKEAYPAEVRDLRGLYQIELMERIRSMEAAADTLVAEGWRKPTAETLFHLAHRCAGSAGLFGLGGVARAAGVLESRLKRLLDGWPPSGSAAELKTLVKAVAASASRECRRPERARPTRVRR
jgi:two-component system, OmpR family, response regulator